MGPKISAHFLYIAFSRSRQSIIIIKNITLIFTESLQACYIFIYRFLEQSEPGGGGEEMRNKKLKMGLKNSQDLIRDTMRMYNIPYPDLFKD